MEEQVKKGGICWFEYSLGRTGKGIQMWVKSVPELEDYFKNISNGSYNPMEIYSRDWLSDRGPLLVYDLAKEQPPSIRYSINRPGDSLESSRDGKINISFLRLVGISSPDGVRFTIASPCSEDFLRKYSKDISTEVKKFFMENIIPVQINVRIVSMDI